MNHDTSEYPVREDAATVLSDMAARLTLADLPADVVTTAKAGILDTIGVCVAATAAAPEYIDPFKRYLGRGAGGAVPAPGLGRSVDVFDGILWLGALAHALDFDDVAGYSHPSGPVVSAALPVAHDRGISGGDLLTSVAVGQDMVVRLAQSVRKPLSAYGWLPSIPGIIGAAATTAKLIGLDATQTRDAMGLALHQTSGTMQALASSGSAYRAVREGFNARAGVLSAFLAQDGLPGDVDSLEGQYGYFDQFFDGDYDPEFLARPDLLGPLITFKQWPCAGHPQLFLTAIDQLVRAGRVDVGAIESIHIAGCSDLLPHQCEPLDLRAAPTQSIDAKVSIPFLIGTMLTMGSISIEDFSPGGLANKEAIELGRTVTWEQRPELKRGSNGYGVGVVEVRHANGQDARIEVEHPLGHPDNPLSWDLIVEKFRRCVDVAGLSKSSADRVVSAVEGLEDLASTESLLGSFDG